MKKTKRNVCGNPYTNNKGGKIEAPRNPGSGDPKSSVITTTGDLRSKKK